MALGRNVVLRPKIGFGMASAKASIEGCPTELNCEGSSSTKPLLAPEATLVLFTKSFSLSIDLRYARVLADPAVESLIFSVGVGF